ncbi:MAG: isocitrate/isopropylmalate dehydrogenase family protein [Holophagaceae bacterium]|nr:isocitrate/isopropylmalate dehydrogenase family protein [Holophagaceae bacterium]
MLLRLGLSIPYSLVRTLGMLRIAIIPGDGIGPEVMAETTPLLEWVRTRGRQIEWEIFPHGADHFLTTGETLSNETFICIRDTFDAILFGAVGDPRVPDGRHAEEILLRLRKDLLLRVNQRPCAPILDRHVPLKGVAAAKIHIEVFRENTEGLYCLKGESTQHGATDFAIHTEAAVHCLLKAAFQRAETLGMPLTLAHKANVLKHGHGLWMRVFRGLQLEFPAVRSSAMHADALLCALVERPWDFGVIAADNFIGDLISDLLAAFQGGMGIAASANLAVKHDPAFAGHPFRCTGLFEPVHGSAPDITGKGVANPTGAMLCAVLMFRHLGWIKEAQDVETSIKKALQEGAATRDLGGVLTTTEMGRALRAGLH